VYFINNGRTKIDFYSNGNIAKVYDGVTADTYFAAPEFFSQSFHVVIPSATQSARAFTAAGAQPPRVIQTTDEIYFQYSKIAADSTSFNIDVNVSYKKSNNPDEIIATMKVVNNSNDIITGIIFPWLNGWRNPADKSVTKALLGPHFELNPETLANNWQIAWAKNFREEMTADYPVNMALPWIDISNGQGGISLLNYQKEPLHCYATMKNQRDFKTGENCVGVFFGFYAYVRPGEEWQSPDIGIALHSGDYHCTADRYRNWMNNWLKVTKNTNEFKSSIGSLHTYLRSFDGTEHHTIEEIPKMAASARNCGISEFCIWDRLTLGIYGTAYKNDEDLLDYSPEEISKLKLAIGQAVAEGSDMSSLVNFRLVNPQRDFFQKNNLMPETQQLLCGTTKYEAWPVANIPGRFYPTAHLGPGCYTFSPFSAKYHERVLKKIDKYLELGYTSIFYDHPFENLPDYSRRNSNKLPEKTYAELLKLIQKVRIKMQAKHANTTIMGEQCDIFASQIIDQWMCWLWSDAPGSISSLRQLRYSLPQTTFNCVIPVETGNYQQFCGLASHAFAIGAKLFITVNSLTGSMLDVPEFGRHVLKLAELRKYCCEKIVNARFCDNLGFKIIGDEDIVAYSYDSQSGPALIICAPAKSGRVKITVDRNFFTNKSISPAGRICNMNLEEQIMTGDTGHFSLNASEVLVWML
jgi:hypothetical protein